MNPILSVNIIINVLSVLVGVVVIIMWFMEEVGWVIADYKFWTKKYDLEYSTFPP